ncbi:TPA: hypothetical protein HA318_03255, partial [Candidatus Micrarchaeota archaeon]|nr:hypothetical protein [Candidatus Micrarchaeota archaeon]
MNKVAVLLILLVSLSLLGCTQSAPRASPSPSQEALEATVEPTAIAEPTALPEPVEETPAATIAPEEETSIEATLVPSSTATATPVSTPVSTFAPTVVASATVRIQPTDLQYVGAFRVPETGSYEVESWYYGGAMIAYYPQGDAAGSGDGFSGSLYGTGLATQHRVSEITIPAPVISVSKNAEELNTATTLQPFTNIGYALFGETEIPHAGLVYLPAQG